jgi:hypothetical protein
VPANLFWLDEYATLERGIFDELLELEAERRAQAIDQAFRAELAAAFREDRDARPVTVWFGWRPSELGSQPGAREGIEAELPPDGQARLYI